MAQGSGPSLDETINYIIEKIENGSAKPRYKVTRTGSCSLRIEARYGVVSDSQYDFDLSDLDTNQNDSLHIIAKNRRRLISRAVISLMSKFGNTVTTDASGDRVLIPGGDVFREKTYKMFIHLDDTEIENRVKKAFAHAATLCSAGKVDNDPFK